MKKHGCEEDKTPQKSANKVHGQNLIIDKVCR